MAAKLRSVAGMHPYDVSGEQVAEPAPHRGRRKLWLAIAASVVAVLAIGTVVIVLQGEDNPSAADVITVKGVLVLSGPITVIANGAGPDCQGVGGFSDIRSGTQVTITDAGGKTIALGELQPGLGRAPKCEFPFEVADVPAGHDFYGIEVSHRGRVQYTRSQMIDGPTLSLKI